MPYAIIREKQHGNVPYDACKPAFIMKVERETDNSLFGAILDDAGQPCVMRYGAYEARPTIAKLRSYPNVEVVSPGRVDKMRCIVRLASFEDAADALPRMRAAWEAVSNDEVVAASSASKIAQEARESRRRLLMEAIDEALKPEHEAFCAAVRAEHDARRNYNAARTNAARAAIERSLEPVAEMPSVDDLVQAGIEAEAFENRLGLVRQAMSGEESVIAALDEIEFEGVDFGGADIIDARDAFEVRLAS